MRRGPGRHPALETAVFAAALLLSAFIARELWSRRRAALRAPEAAGLQPAAPNLSRAPLPLEAGTRRTERAVTGVAPIKLVRARRRKPDVVPAPR